MGSQQTVINYANSQVYTGAVSENIPNGKGTLALSSRTIFEGYFQKGQPTKGKINSKQYVYDGELTKDQITGNGTLIDKNNMLYEGKFKNGTFAIGTISQRNSKNEIICTFKGKIVTSPFEIAQGVLQINIKPNNNQGSTQLKIKQEGIFQKSRLKEKGSYQFVNGDIYEGNFLMGKFEGQGLYKGKNITINSIFQNNVPQQKTQIVFSNGDVYKGSLKDGQVHGKGQYAYKDGTLYQGDFYFGSLWGVCKIIYAKGGSIDSYQGQINQGLYNGIGTLYFTNGVIYKGYFLQGAKNGYGVLIYGSSKYKCLYLMDQLSGQLKLID